MAETLTLLEELIGRGDPETIIKCSTPCGARTMAKAICAADPEAERDFGEGGLAHYLRAKARPQERAARRALDEAAAIEAAKPLLTLDLLAHGIRSQDAELRRMAFAFIGTPEKLAATAAHLIEHDAEARSRFRDVNELAAFLRADPQRKPRSVSVAPAAPALVAAEPDLTDEEIIRRLGFRSHRSLWAALDQLHIWPRSVNGGTPRYDRYQRSKIADRVADPALVDRIVASLNRRLETEEREEETRLARRREAQRILEETA